ncbi:MAG: hypothetical protein HYW00_00835 [Candidatus Colwellbacteria bacterium]|nr:hypothetical protein [Candidatus Colwellbacteria bacterium]
MGNLFLLLLIVFIIFLVARRRELGFLKNRYYVILGLLSLAWWTFLIIDQLRTKLVCTPDDQLCNSGNTFWGDFTWGSMLAIFSLLIVWIPAVSIGLYLARGKK